MFSPHHPSSRTPGAATFRPGQDHLQPEGVYTLTRPFSVIYDPQSRRAAAYDSLNHLITDDASPELTLYAISMNHRRAAWDEAMWRVGGIWTPLPGWLEDPIVRARCWVFYCRNGTETLEELLAIPME